MPESVASITSGTTPSDAWKSTAPSGAKMRSTSASIRRRFFVPPLGSLALKTSRSWSAAGLPDLGEPAGQGLRGALLLVAAGDPRRAAGSAGTEDVGAAVPGDAARLQVLLLDGEQRRHVAEAAALVLHGAERS